MGSLQPVRPVCLYVCIMAGPLLILETVCPLAFKFGSVSCSWTLWDVHLVDNPHLRNAQKDRQMDREMDRHLWSCLVFCASPTCHFFRVMAWFNVSLWVRVMQIRVLVGTCWSEGLLKQGYHGYVGHINTYAPQEIAWVLETKTVKGKTSWFLSQVWVRLK